MSIQYVFARIGLVVCGLVAGTICALPADAHSDIFLTNVGGQVAVGGANDLEEANPYYELTTQVFEGVMITNYPPGPAAADFGRGEPGVFALGSGSSELPAGATALAGNANVSLSFPMFSVNGNSASLFYWDSNGAVDFQPVMQQGVAIALDPNPFVATAANGFLHEYPAFTLDNGTTGLPDAGIYLVSPTASVAGMTDSKPFFMVWLVDQSLCDDDAAEDLEAALEAGEPYQGRDYGFFGNAVDYVQSNLVAPEPSSAVLGAIALLGFASCNKRRRPIQGGV